MVEALISQPSEVPALGSPQLVRTVQLVARYVFGLGALRAATTLRSRRPTGENGTHT